MTYVCEGAVAQEDSTGNSGVVLAGEFQRTWLGRGVRHKETNASRSDQAHLYRIMLRPVAVASDRPHEQKRFAAAQRRNVLCVVASPDGRGGSLTIRQNALVFSSLLDSGQHLVHELLPGRSAWLQVIAGEVVLQDHVLFRGDGAGLLGEASVSVTARESSEILLVDLGPAPSGPVTRDSQSDC